jgi:hypothetical protein
MRSDVFVVGCGRSGTSLIAGLLADAGYHTGRNMLPASPSNPKGFFQDADVIRLNEEILEACMPVKPAGVPPGYCWDLPRRGQRWLARLGKDATIRASEAQELAMARIAANKPFCLKDPRYSYTLAPWLRFAHAPKIVCAFRHPAEFVSSVFTLCQIEPSHHDIAVSVGQLFQVWQCAYSFLLARHDTKDWLFLEYESLFQPRGLQRLEGYLDIGLRADVVDRTLKRSDALVGLPPSVARLFARLQRLSNDDSAR